MRLVILAAVIQEVRGEPGCHNDPRLLRSAWSCARLCARRLLRDEEEESFSAHP